MSPVIWTICLSTLLVGAAQDGPTEITLGAQRSSRVGPSSPPVESPGLRARRGGPYRGESLGFRPQRSGTVTVLAISHDFDTYLIARRSDEVLAESDGGWIGTHAQLTFEVEAGVEYRLEVVAVDSRLGESRVEILEGSPPELEPLERRRLEIEDAQRAVESRRRRPDEASPLAEALNRLGNLLFTSGRLEEAEAVFREQLTLSEKHIGPEDESTLSALANLAVVAGELGRHDEAIQTYERLLSTLESQPAPNHPAIATVQANLARLLGYQARYGEAETLLRSSLQTFIRLVGPDHPNLAHVTTSLAGTLLDQERAGEAETLYRRALAIYEKHPAASRELARVHNDLGSALRAQGRLDLARDEHRRALEVSRRHFGDEHPNTVAALQNLASVAAQLGQPGEAAESLRALLPILERTVGPDHPNVAVAQKNLADALLETGDVEAARAFAEDALSIEAKKLPEEHPARGRTHVLLARCAGDDDEAAREHWDRALALYEQALGFSHRFTGDQLLAAATDARARGEGERAARLAERGFRSRLEWTELQMPLLPPEDRFRFAAELGMALDLHLATASLTTNQCYERVASWKGLVYRTSLRSQQSLEAGLDASQREQVSEIELLAEQLSELAFATNVSNPRDHLDQMKEIRDRKRALEGELIRSFDLGPDSRRISVAALAAALPVGSAILDLSLHRQDEGPGPEVRAWILRAGAESVDEVSLGSALALEELIPSHDDSSGTRGVVAPKGVTSRKGASLREALWAPLQERLAESTLVFVIPDAFLTRLPFETIPLESGRFLIEDMQFVYAVDPVSLLQHLEADAPRRARAPSLLAVGGVDYLAANAAGGGSPTRSSARWAPLVGTRAEVDTLLEAHRHQFGEESSALALMGEAATEEGIRGELSRYDSIHLATHGFCEPDGLPFMKETKLPTASLPPGLLSGLVLGGADAASRSEDGDGYLTATEVASLDLSRCELVVLSACETGLGTPRSGEGMLSLRRAFHEAGADTVLSSLWKVGDEDTRQLMLRFYHFLWQEGLPPGQALRRAQLEMLEQNRVQGDARPESWGAFVLSGEWR
ncbi:MAG: CHAT domain-containing tetratricopeptide repeat protein [Planctomycetota bacterium]